MRKDQESISPPQHAQVFIEHYDHLLGWARYLCRNDQTAAEDLVQNAYIQFISYSPPLESIENRLGYLRRLLGNVYKNQLVRASAQKRSAEGGADLPLLEELAGYDIYDNEKARDMLLEIAYFAGERRLQSKTGSVLILRFLLGYYPKEISQILMASVFAVNNLIMRGRQELREFLKNPSKKRIAKQG